MKSESFYPIQIIKKLRNNLLTHPIKEADLEALEEVLNKKIYMYETAFKLLHKVVWSYEFSTKCFYATTSSSLYFAGRTYVEDRASEIFKLKLIHRESASEVKRIIKQLKSKIPKGQGEIRLADKDGHEFWILVHYETFFDTDNNPLYAVFLGEDISEVKQSQYNYHEKLDELLTVADDIILSAKVNITKNITEYFARGFDNMKNRAVGETVEQLAPHFLAKISEKTAVKKIKKYFNQTFLLQLAKSGAAERPYSFQYIMPDGIIKWVEGIVRFFHTSSGWYCYYYVKDIDHLKRVEQDLEKQAKYDKITGLYNRETVIELLNNLINKEHENLFGLFLFNVDNVTQLIRNDGYSAAEKVLVELAKLITMSVSGEKVIGRTDGFEIIVLVRGSRTHDNAIACVQKILDDMHQMSRFPDIISRISVSAGICFAEKDIVKCFDWYFQNVRVALDEAKRNGKNRYAVFGTRIEDNVEKEIIISQKSITKIVKDVNNNVLDLEENTQKVPKFVEWGVLQFSRFPFKSAVKIVLEKICRYYSADRAFVHFAVPGTLKLESRELWQIEDNDDWILPELGQVDKLFEEFITAFRQGESLLCGPIENIKDTHPYAYKCLKEFNTSSFLDYPITIDGEINGYIGIDNPRRNFAQFEVLYTISSLIGVQKKVNRLEERITYLEHNDLLTETQNRKSFTNYIDNLNVNMLSSIGIAVVHIRNLKTLNNSFGRDHVDLLLKIISQTLRKYFDSLSVYRRSGNEFIILQENIDFEAFQQRLDKIQAEVYTSYHDVISIGSAWNDNEIDIDSLIYAADLSLNPNMIDKISDSSFNGSGLIRDNFNQLKKEIAEGQYYLYLQPKASFKNRSITSAEALVRYCDKNGKIITPAMFIHKLEKTGLIYLIDFFILEEVCKFQERQKKMGRDTLNISLNFSRKTLMIKNLIERMADITDKYDVPRTKIEIEITESVGDVEQKTISTLGKKIRDAGFRLSLDDFGSHYCNMEVLSSMELDALKLDKSLVKDVYASERSRKVIENFLKTCKELNIVSIAEGVETEDQFKILKEMGCDFAQGYLFNKPLAADKFEDLYL
jgi:diguanylate cyclase (GGDEF)-like protein